MRDTDPSQEGKTQKASKLHLQLHAQVISVKKPHTAVVNLSARPAEQMRSLLQMLSWTSRLAD